MAPHGRKYIVAPFILTLIKPQNKDSNNKMPTTRTVVSNAVVTIKRPDFMRCQNQTNLTQAVIRVLMLHYQPLDKENLDLF